MIFVVPAVSESSSPENGADGAVVKPAEPQLVVPGIVVSNKWGPDGSVVLVVDAIVPVVVVVDVNAVVVVVDADVVLVVVDTGAVVVVVPWSCMVAFSPMAPGPGKSKAASTPALPVEGMQKTDPRPSGCAAPSVRSPAGVPVSTIRCGSQAPVPEPVQQENGAPAPEQLALAMPNAPGFPWLGQKRLVALVREAVLVVSGLMESEMDPICFVGSGGHSTVVPRLPTPAQVLPAFGPALQLPPRHSGQGEAKCR
jgi:hypothetical protein